jgi:hypothetical protein
LGRADRYDSARSAIATAFLGPAGDIRHAIERIKHAAREPRFLSYDRMLAEERAKAGGSG